MSEANLPHSLAASASRKRSEQQELALAVLQLFELVLAMHDGKFPSEDTIDRISDYADEYKPRLERILRNARKATQST